MKFKKQPTFLIILSIISVTVSVVDTQAKTEPSPYDLVISGLVDQPLNLTYNELQRFPMISEVALMKCVIGWTELYNWTGIPLLFLLSKTGVKAEAKEVVFYASDDFSSSLTIERALHPTTLLALKANGTVLSHSTGYPYRLVVPCKYGYKWVKRITEIEVVDYDYKGTYESKGYSDEADIPDCTLPPTTPPFETFQVALGNTTESITILSNSTINSFDFDTSRAHICFNITGPPGTTGYCYATIPKELLWCDSQEQWQVWTNNTSIEDIKVMEYTNYTYIHFTYNHNIQEVQIKGVHVIPEFPTWAPMLLILAVLTVFIAIYKRRLKTPIHQRSSLRRNPITEENVPEAGLLKTKYKFSPAEAIILPAASTIGADVPATGGAKQYEDEWKKCRDTSFETL